MKFHLLEGRHIQNEQTKDGKVIEREYKVTKDAKTNSRIHPVIESKMDLAARFGADKFQRIHEDK